MKVKKTDLPVMPPEDILPSLDDEADESDMDDGNFPYRFFISHTIDLTRVSILNRYGRR